MKSFIATVLAASLTLGAFGAAPARADIDGGDVATAIIGLAIIAGIADAVDNNRNRNQSDGYYDRDRYNHPAPRASRQLYALPGECLRQFETYQHQFRGFGRRCLRRNSVNLDQLPDWCERDALTRRGWRTVYGARCLRQAGYYIDGRHGHYHDH